MKSSWNQQRFQAGRAPDPKRNQRFQFNSPKPLSQHSYAKDKCFRGICERFFCVLIMPLFSHFVPLDIGLLKKRKKKISNQYARGIIDPQLQKPLRETAFVSMVPFLK